MNGMTIAALEYCYRSMETRIVKLGLSFDLPKAGLAEDERWSRDIRLDGNIG